MVTGHGFASNYRTNKVNKALEFFVLSSSTKLRLPYVLLLNDQDFGVVLISKLSGS